MLTTGLTDGAVPPSDSEPDPACGGVFAVVDDVAFAVVVGVVVVDVAADGVGGLATGWVLCAAGAVVVVVDGRVVGGEVVVVGAVVEVVEVVEVVDPAGAVVDDVVLGVVVLGVVVLGVVVLGVVVLGVVVLGVDVVGRAVVGEVVVEGATVVAVVAVEEVVAPVAEAASAAAVPEPRVAIDPMPPARDRGTSSAAVTRPGRIRRTSERRVEGAKCAAARVVAAKWAGATDVPDLKWAGVTRLRGSLGRLDIGRSPRASLRTVVPLGGTTP